MFPIRTPSGCFPNLIDWKLEDSGTLTVVLNHNHCKERGQICENVSKNRTNKEDKCCCSVLVVFLNQYNNQYINNCSNGYAARITRCRWRILLANMSNVFPMLFSHLVCCCSRYMHLLTVQPVYLNEKKMAFSITVTALTGQVTYFSPNSPLLRLPPADEPGSSARNPAAAGARSWGGV